MEYKIIFSNSKEFEQEIGYHLHQFNCEHCKFIHQHSDGKQSKAIVAHFGIYDQHQNLVGGATGWINFGWYYLDQLWLSEAHRKQRLGTQLIKLIENFAKENKAIGIRTETWSFQAKGFYEKMGFKLYAQLKDCPPGGTEYFFMKRIGNKKGEN